MIIAVACEEQCTFDHSQISNEKWWKFLVSFAEQSKKSILWIIFNFLRLVHRYHRKAPSKLKMVVVIIAVACEEQLYIWSLTDPKEKNDRNLWFLLLDRAEELVYESFIIFENRSVNAREKHSQMENTDGDHCCC